VQPKRPVILGILNVTPDSFSDGGQFQTDKQAIQHALAMHAAGADIIDIGGESTRPGGSPVTPGEEIRRVLPIVRSLKKKGLRLSLDSRRPEVVTACLPFIDWINDVSGMSDPAMRALAAKSRKPVILMHATELPVDPTKIPRYKNVVADLAVFFKKRIKECEAAGIQKKKIMIDPGIGFGKNLKHNLQLIAHLKKLETIAPVCLGASRKSFIGQMDGSEADARLGGSLAAVLAGWQQGVRVFRVHDVAETAQALKVAAKIAAC